MSVLSRSVLTRVPVTEYVYEGFGFNFKQFLFYVYGHFCLRVCPRTTCKSCVCGGEERALRASDLLELGIRDSCEPPCGC